MSSAPRGIQQRLSRAWYSASVEDFLGSSIDEIVGRLTRESSSFSVDPAQTAAWEAQIMLLQSKLRDLKGHIFFEFNIPRMGKRIDVVFISESVIFVIEFKVGESSAERSALDQVWDYALDLKNFHEGSHTLAIVPILIATEASALREVSLHRDADDVCRPVAVASSQLKEFLIETLKTFSGHQVDAAVWLGSSYRPTPTIVEAAKALYASHSVEAIRYFDAGADNLRLTSARVDEIVRLTHQQKEKAICFVTGVPGAGKTLVGLNLATAHSSAEDLNHAVFLSGNGPLVEVLREALTRDEVARRKANGEKVRKGRVKESIKAFIQNVHHFRDEALRDPVKPPIEHVVIFDEAQRAWNLRQTANFMQRKKGQPGFAQSEPEFLISYMERHQDWAAIVCLVGGGQEINTGEAGISAWLEAIIEKFPEWKIYISAKLTDREYAAGASIEIASQQTSTQFEPHLHLSVPMRSFRSEHVSSFVKALLDCDREEASRLFSDLHESYPIVVTRDLPLAKKWIRARSRGTERSGLVASSKALRLKPYAVDIRVDIEPTHWFLNERDDVRSSCYLEDAATEFQVQGLELDWVCVTWDGDLRFNDEGWSYHDFRGTRWQNIKSADNQNYLKNAYRVLLTRARQGMVIFIPPGDAEDPTRSPEFYDRTYRYLSELGIPAVDACSLKSEAC